MARISRNPRKPPSPSKRPRPRPSSTSPKSFAGRYRQDRPDPRDDFDSRDDANPRPRPSAPALASSAQAFRSPTNVAPADLVAKAAVEIAETAERAVDEEGYRADRSLALGLKKRRDLALPDHRFISEAVMALFRWRGWIDQIGMTSTAERLLMAWMLDADTIHPICRVWARQTGHDPGNLIALGKAPNWPARSESIKRWLRDRKLVADPWRLFPPWLREVLPSPPGDSSMKTRYVETLQCLQSRPPLWVRARKNREKNVWREFTSNGITPQHSAHILQAARIPRESDLPHQAVFEQGLVEIQDLASQAVSVVCDPRPGQRWWDVCAGAGGKTLHLADLMDSKGVVIATDVVEHKLKELVRRARRAEFSNISTKLWDGRKPIGKTGSFHGVLVDAPCSGIGTWRRNPDARWTTKRDAVARLAKIQSEILQRVAPAVRPGGVLVYSVCTLAVPETRDVVEQFLKTHPDFQLAPFAHPLADQEMTDGMLWIWPQDSDSDAMFIAKFIRSVKATTEK